MKNKFKLLSICLLATCLMGSTACSLLGESAESSTESTGSSESSVEIPESSEDSGVDSTGSEDSGVESEKYTVVFVDYNDSVISSAEYEIGATVTVPETPSRAADETYTYEFAGWDSEVGEVEGDKTYKATYTATYIEYKVVFLNENGEEITSANYHYGDTVTAPALPTKDADETYTYTYTWNKEIVNVTGEETYTAVCTPAFIEYTVVFLNEDGSELSTATYHYGDTVAEPVAPAKAADKTYTYEFAGWNNAVTAVAGDATYTAIYTPVYIDYTIVFLDEDGSELSTATYHYGDTVVEPATPIKAATTIFTFTFDGWDSEIVTVAGNATYTAKYSATLASGVTANEVSATAGEGFVLSAGGIGGGANYTLGQQSDDGDETPSYVKQSYLAIDGEFNMDDYVAFDFTGKNMPEIAFFAKNYNDSMYAEGTSKQGIVVYTGITTWDAQDASITSNKPNGSFINYGFPYMIQDAADGGFVRDSFAASALGRANLVDGTHYRVIMGFTKYVENGGIQLNWYLYNLDTKEVVEQSSMATWNFFTGSNARVGNMTVEDLVGSIVLYGKFGTETTIDKLHGVYENTNINDLAAGLNEGKTYTVTFKDVNGNALKTMTDVAFGASVAYEEDLPTPETAEDALFTYSYAWDKEFTPVYSDAVYTLKLISTAKSGYNASNVTVQGEGIVLGAGGIGDGANYTMGQNKGGYVNQAYLGIEGNYGLDNYIVFDFTGKNLPEIAFFANNYNNSMYAEGTSKQGIVVVTGITTWDGQLGSGVNGNGTQINYGFPYMIQDAADGGFCKGAFAESALGRANLVDDTHYRVIMGFTGSGSAITLNWYLYNLDTNTVVEQGSMTTWNFFTGNNAQVGNMTINDLSGSIVLYGKFGTTCTIDKLHGVEADTFENVVAKYTA